MDSKKEIITLKDGYYQNANFTPNLHKVEGTNVTIHHVVSFDFPDMKSEG